MTPKAEAYRLDARVTGRVQGVGYRAFVVRAARELEITGSVANNSDGSVSVVGVGTLTALELLLNALHEGPRFGRVEAVEAHWGRQPEAPPDFAVRR